MDGIFVKKRSNNKINNILSEVQKFGITKVDNFFNENQINEIKKNYNEIIKNKEIDERNQFQIEEEDFINNEVLKKYFIDEEFYKNIANIYLNGAPLEKVWEVKELCQCSRKILQTINGTMMVK